MTKRQLMVVFAQESIRAYEIWQCARTWDNMVSAVARCAGISRKESSRKLERVYGKMFAKGSI